jgi:hypothetical protein
MGGQLGLLTFLTNWFYCVISGLQSHLFGSSKEVRRGRLYSIPRRIDFPPLTNQQ